MRTQNQHEIAIEDEYIKTKVLVHKNPLFDHSNVLVLSVKLLVVITEINMELINDLKSLKE